MHRIFCATPWEMEAERLRFYDIIGRFNENVAMPKGVLYIPVTLTNVTDKRPLQYAVDRNIRECRHYILLLSEDWGPVERNFKSEYGHACRCIDDPTSPLKTVSVLAKREPSGQPWAQGLPEPQATFATPAEFDACVDALLSEWWAAMPADENERRQSAA